MGGHLGYQFQVTDSLQGRGNMIRRTPHCPDGNPDRVIGNIHFLTADFEVTVDQGILNKYFFVSVPDKAGREMMGGVVPLIKYFLMPGGFVFTVFEIRQQIFKIFEMLIPGHQVKTQHLQAAVVSQSSGTGMILADGVAEKGDHPVNIAFTGLAGKIR